VTPKLGILDVEGSLDDGLVLAPMAERLGCTRYWIAEHQPQPTPLLHVAILAGLTERIRVGTAGVLFHYYPPVRTAHDFHFLERAYEGRIDAGFCAGIDPRVSATDLDGRDHQALANGYADRVAHLVAMLRNTPSDAGFDAKRAWRDVPPEPPEIWSLGGGARSADLAAAHGLGFGFSLLYRLSIDDPTIVRRYRDRFVPSQHQPEPRVVMAVCAICRDSDDDARRAAAAYPGTFFVPRIVGGPVECAAELRALCERYAVDEIVVADLEREQALRKRCYELLATAL
jgi:luciferase family oxidoreductase group 1